MGDKKIRILLNVLSAGSGIIVSNVDIVVTPDAKPTMEKTMTKKLTLEDCYPERKLRSKKELIKVLNLTKEKISANKKRSV